MTVVDRITYICESCDVTQSTPIKKPLTKCQAYWKGRPCKGRLLQIDPKPASTAGAEPGGKPATTPSTN